MNWWKLVDTFVIDETFCHSIIYAACIDININDEFKFDEIQRLRKLVKLKGSQYLECISKASLQFRNPCLQPTSQVYPQT